MADKGRLNWLLGMALIALVLGSIFFGSTLGGDDDKASRSLTTTGQGTATVIPDQLSFNVGVSVSRPDVAGAMKTANAELDKVMAALAKAGVAERDMKTTNLSINPQYDERGNRITGYQVDQQLSVKVRGLAKAGATISAATAAAGNDARLDGISFDVQDRAAVLAEARKAAVAAARRDAETYAKASGMTLGDVVRLKEVTAPEPSPRPVDGFADLAMAAPQAAKIAPGEQDFKIRLEVVWELEG